MVSLGGDIWEVPGRDGHRVGRRPTAAAHDLTSINLSWNVLIVNVSLFFNVISDFTQLDDVPAAPDPGSALKLRSAHCGVQVS